MNSKGCDIFNRFDVVFGMSSNEWQIKLKKFKIYLNRLGDPSIRYHCDIDLYRLCDFVGQVK